MNSQIANYVNNGGFENLIDCDQPSLIYKAKYWNAIDSANGGWSVLASNCYSNVPQNGAGFQWPRYGESYVRTGFFCPPPSCAPDLNRLYLKNSMKAKLQANKTYCVKFYVNIFNPSTFGIDGFAAFFGDNTLDTITKPNVPLTYLTPQIKNLNNNIITDTLNWTLITGTFVATGNEKFAVIGNFKSDVATNTLAINPTYSPTVFSDVCIDHVSCIDIDLPAFAGHDTTCIPGTSVYIGREQDVGIDEDCIWYKLPNMTTTIDTAAGLWVHPTTTSTYVVRQEICGNIKWDTVVVYEDHVGLSKLNLLSNQLTVYPVPASNYLELKISNQEFFKEFKSLLIYNHLGQLIREEEINFTEVSVKLKTDNLQDGVYSLALKNSNSDCLNKRFIIAH